jgi:hypothetical protein
MSKKPIELNVSSSDETNQLKKLSKKEIGKQISGNPDNWDFKNLSTIIDLYKKTFPGRLDRMKHDVDVEVALSPKETTMDRHDGMWMPADLQEVLEAAYPSFWTNRKHKSWFLRKFPVFKIKERKEYERS